MVMYTVFFTIVNLLIAAWWWCTRNTKRKARIFQLLLVGNFFIYSGMSNVIFSTIPCVEYDYGDERGTLWLLRADRTCPCCAARSLLAVLTRRPPPALSRSFARQLASTATRPTTRSPYCGPA